MRTSVEINADITEARQELAALKQAWLDAINGSWKTRDGNASREVAPRSPSELQNQIRLKKAEIRDLEAELAKTNRYAFKVGVAR